MNPEEVMHEDPVANILSKTHQGATGNLGIELNRHRIIDYHTWVDQQRKRARAHFLKL
jgi:hypothetical protein